MDCNEFVFKRLKEFGLKKDIVDECLKKVAKSVNLSVDDVCQIIQKKLTDIETSCINRYSNSKPLKDYQQAVVKFMNTHRGIIAAFDLGMGKTFTAIATAECLRKQAKYFGVDIKIVVVTTPTLQANFKKEMELVGVKEKNYTFYYLNTFANMLNKNEFDCSRSLLIIDEAHDLRTDYRGQFGTSGPVKKKPTKHSNAKSLVECAKKAWKVLLLTGTPIYNLPHDVVNLVAMVKGVEPMLKSRFITNTDIKQPVLFKNTFGCVFAFKKRGVEDTKDYPQRIDEYEWIKMTPKYLSKYNQVESEYWKKYSKKRSDESVKKMFMTSLRKATLTSDDVPNPKIERALEIIQLGMKTVVYSDYKHAGIDKIYNILKQKGIKVVKITSDTTPEDREKYVKRFNKSKRMNVMLISKAGRQGIDLKGVRHLIILEKGWVRSGEEQVIGRSVRLGSHTHLPNDEKNVTIHHLMLIKPTDEAYIQKGYPPSGYHESVDLYLYKYAQSKHQTNTGFERRLESVDIFHSECI